MVGEQSALALAPSISRPLPLTLPPSHPPLSPFALSLLSLSFLSSLFLPLSPHPLIRTRKQCRRRRRRRNSSSPEYAVVHFAHAFVYPSSRPLAPPTLILQPTAPCSLTPLRAAPCLVGGQAEPHAAGAEDHAGVEVQAGPQAHRARHSPRLQQRLQLRLTLGGREWGGRGGRSGGGG